MLFRIIMNNEGGKDKSYKVVINYKDNTGDKKHISTKFDNAENFEFNVEEMVKSIEARYETSFNCRGFRILEAENNNYWGKGAEEQKKKLSKIGRFLVIRQKQIVCIKLIIFLLMVVFLKMLLVFHII